MKNYLMPAIDKLLVRKRFIIEMVFGILKNAMSLEHARHRSPINAFVHLIATLVAYSYKTSKPKIKAFLIPAYALFGFFQAKREDMAENI